MRDQMFVMPSGHLENSKDNVGIIDIFTVLEFWLWVLNLGKAISKRVIREDMSWAFAIDAWRQEIVSGNI